MYLLDTNVVSELRKNRPHGAVVAWLQNVPDRDIFLSTVTLGEIQAGIELTREQDPARAALIEDWADQIAASYNILPMDAASFRLYARLMHRHAAEDAMIAACAMTHQLTLVTRNTRDFQRYSIKLLYPFS
jgi:predicted nucleic acid-binding protein